MKDSSAKRRFDVIGTRHYFAGAHPRAAQLMATHCLDRERLVLEIPRDEVPHIDYEVRSYAVCAIVEAVAFLEARVNEIWHAARESNPGLGKPALRRPGQ